MNFKVGDTLEYHSQIGEHKIPIFVTVLKVTVGYYFVKESIGHGHNSLTYHMSEEQLESIAKFAKSCKQTSGHHLTSIFK